MKVVRAEEQAGRCSKGRATSIGVNYVWSCLRLTNHEAQGIIDFYRVKVTAQEQVFGYAGKFVILLSANYLFKAADYYIHQIDWHKDNRFRYSRRYTKTSMAIPKLQSF